ncbi:MAG: RING finger protein [Candidatus Hodarchaeota archaeon]
MFVFVAPFIISLLLFCLLLIIYAFVKITMKLIRWVIRKLANFVRWVTRTTRHVISKGLAFGRSVVIYVMQASKRLIMACSRWIGSLNQRVRHRGYSTYHTPTPHGTGQVKDLDTEYYSYSYPIDHSTPRATSTLIMEDTSSKTTLERMSTRQVRQVRFCQICGALLDLSLPSPDMSIICCECGSDLSLGIDPICRKPVIRGEDAVRCPHCLTVFHRHHIAVWLSSQGSCPFCNSLFTQETVETT